MAPIENFMNASECRPRYVVVATGVIQIQSNPMDLAVAPDRVQIPVCVKTVHVVGFGIEDPETLRLNALEKISDAYPEADNLCANVMDIPKTLKPQEVC